MISKNIDTPDSNIIESMNQAFDNGSFYGLEYVLDEWVEKTPVPSANQNTVDWFGFRDFAS
ncbi:MAG: hypothetical protein PHR16_13595 [Methylovulum sp.]|nr:hypothetical protein [Methylovulum sp.]